MKVSVVVINYNYEDFVLDAVDSVLAQTHEVDEVIVVDDGSTDSSRERLTERYGGNPKVLFVFKENEGHMSGFNEGYARSTGDVVFFLDSDDMYKSNHVEDLMAVYTEDSSIDYAFCAYEYCGEMDGVGYNTTEFSRCMGYTPIANYLGDFWVGGPTSVISIKRTLANRVFPYPKEWYFRTNNNGEIGLVHGSSILGGKKYYVAKPNVWYRSHASNFDLNKSKSPSFHARIHQFHKVAEEYYWKKASLPENFVWRIVDEFRTIERPTQDEYQLYRKIIQDNFKWSFSKRKRLRDLKRVMKK